MGVGEAGEEEAPGRAADFGGPGGVGRRENPWGAGPREGSWWRERCAERVTYVCGAGQAQALSLPRVQSYSSVSFPFRSRGRSKESRCVLGRPKVGKTLEGGFRAGREGCRAGACFSISASGALVIIVARGSRVHLRESIAEPREPKILTLSRYRSARETCCSATLRSGPLSDGRKAWSGSGGAGAGRFETTSAEQCGVR